MSSSSIETRSSSERSFWKRPKVWIPGVLGILVGLLVLRSCWKGRQAPDSPAARPVPVVTALAKKGDLVLTLSGLGTVTPTDTVQIRSRVDGQIQRVLFREGQLVHQGEVLVEIDPRPFQVQLMQAEGQRAKNEAAFKNAKTDLERYASLARQGILAKQQLDAQTSMVNQYEAALKADQAQVESAKLNLAYSRVTSPIAGRVGLKQVDQGNMVRANDASPLAVVVPVQPITIIFTIPADSIQQVLRQRSSGAKLMVEAYDRDLKQKLAMGSLLAMDNQVDPATGTVRLKALFDNQDLALFPNQFVNARLLVDTLRDAVLIPTAAVQRGPQGSYVYVVKADQTVELRPVEIQAVEGDGTAVRVGLKPGETVVTDGMERLKPGSLVSTGSTEAPKPSKP
jgi:multidrug efflux system membrane fusion protein